MGRRLSSCCALLFAAACSGAKEGTIALVTGEETDVLTRAPAPTVLVVEQVAPGGQRTELRRSPLPTAELDLGELPSTEAGAIAVTGLDDAGQALVRGQTLFVQWGALASQTLEVFVQRTFELARLPRGPDAFQPAVAASLAGRWLVAAEGTSTVVYDLLGLRSLARAPVLPRPARSLATFGTAAVVIDEEGASTFDFSSGVSVPLEPPPGGGSFAEIAGGARIVADDGAQLVVGATRLEGGPSDRVFVISADGEASFATLTTAREGACATYVEGRGLVVYGGAAEGAGAELLAPRAQASTALPFPADPVAGCAAAGLGSGRVLVAGGRRAPSAPAEGGDAVEGFAPARVLDLACAADCAPSAWPGAMPLARAEAVALGADAAFVAGDDAEGATRAFRASASELREIPLKIPRRGARLVATGGARVFLVGGGSGIEQYLE